MKRFGLFLFGMFICVCAYAQTETTKWYVDGKLYATTSCEYGGDITMPPQLQEKFGYTLSGWEPAMHEIYDMSTIDPTINGTSYTQDANTKKWSATFNYGILYGEAFCSSISDSSYTTDTSGIDSTTIGKYCWCRITEFIPSGNNSIYEPPSSRWIFHFNAYESASLCASRCADHCGYGFYVSSSLRRRAFNITQ